MSRIAKRYAQALLKLTAGNLIQAKAYAQSLTPVNELFQIQDSASVLCSPVMPLDLKKSLLAYGLKTANASDEVQHMVFAVADAGRVQLLPDIIKEYIRLIDEAEGIVHAEISSAVSMPADDIKEIAAALGKLLRKKVQTSQLIDNTLLGGFVVRVGQYLVDLSLKTKLEGIAMSAVQDTFVKGKPS